MSQVKKEKKSNRWKMPVFLLIIMGLLIAWLGFGKGFIQLYQTEIERQAYIERIKTLQQNNNALLEEIERLRTDMDYVELLIKNNFSMIKPNEVIYRFENEHQVDSDTSFDQKNKNESAHPPTNP
jgi:cell division protein FtsB